MTTTDAPYAPGDVAQISAYNAPPGPAEGIYPVTDVTDGKSTRWSVSVDGYDGPLIFPTDGWGRGYLPGLRLARSSAPSVGREVVAKPTAPGIPAALAGQVLTIAAVQSAADEPGGWFLTLTHPEATTYALLSDTWPAPPPSHGQVGPAFACPRCEQITAIYRQEAWADTTQCNAPGCGYSTSRSIGD